MSQHPGSADPLGDLLNTSTPYAPATKDEVAERLRRVSEIKPVEWAAEESREAEPQKAESDGRDDELNIRQAQRNSPRSQAPDLADFLGDAFNIMAYFTRLSSTVEELTAGLDRFSGSDRTGAITVAVDGSGRLVDCTVKSAWRTLLSIEEFGSAAMDAINAAYMARTGAIAGALDATPEPFVSMTLPRLPGVPSMPADFDPEAAIRQTNMVLDEFLTKTEEFEHEIGHLSASAIEIKSEKRRITLSLVNETVTGVHVHKSWLKSADPIRISEEFVSAFDAAAGAVVDHDAIKSSESLMASARELEAINRRLGFDLSGG